MEYDTMIMIINLLIKENKSTKGALSRFKALIYMYYDANKREYHQPITILLFNRD